MTSHPRDMRTPYRRVHGLGSARSGTTHAWHMRLTSFASLLLTLPFIVIMIALTRRNHAATVQILGSPLVAITMLLFIFTNVYHMYLGMQVIIEDYVHTEGRKLALVMGNVFFSIVIGLACTYAILKLSFGV